MSGEVLQTNESLESDPALVNREPFAAGWLFKLRVSDPSEKDHLLSPDSYDQLVAEAP